MAYTTSKRVSIKDFHIPFLVEIGQQIGTSDLSEIVNYLICQAKLGHSPIAQMTAQTPKPTAQTATDDDLADSLAGLL